MVLIAEQTLLETLSYIATIIGAFGFFLAIIFFFIETKRRQEERQLATYDNLSKEYREFLKLCFDHPALQVFDYDFHGTIRQNLSADDKLKKYILFEILVSLLESAFFQYRRHTSDFKRAQWSGWVQYMDDWCGREDFRIAWKEHLSAQFDSDFLAFMNSLMSKYKAEQVQPSKQGPGTEEMKITHNN